MNRRRFLAKVVAVAGGAAAVAALGKSLAAMDCTTKPYLGHDALVCHECEYYNKHIHCAMCGKLSCTDRDSYKRARVCNPCDKEGNKCVYCGKLVDKSAIKARVCYKCSYDHYWDCCKCGRSTGPELG